MTRGRVGRASSAAWRPDRLAPSNVRQTTAVERARSARSPSAAVRSSSGRIGGGGGGGGEEGEDDRERSPALGELDRVRVLDRQEQRQQQEDPGRKQALPIGDGTRRVSAVPGSPQPRDDPDCDPAEDDGLRQSAETPERGA